ncbi:acyltransferase family protein [Polaribacter sp. R77954]|uniref:acyltransferase family protein n=1 Tax=Polaribacter sp. R77954 TaxID=3093870 RepID=UPI0037C82334
MNSLINNRIEWIDTVKGFGIILVVYGHNFPLLENYIYTFHMPLFFLIAGLFHPNKITSTIIKKRAQQILIPYFLWSSLLFLFWYALGRHFGESKAMNLSVFKNLFGVFYAQGDIEYMNWGIPMWFLPAIFLSFLIFGYILKFKQKVHQIIIAVILIIIGFLIPKLTDFHLVWSLDVVLVSLVFYAIGYYFKAFILSDKMQYQKPVLLLFFIVHLFISIFFENKVDMYRSNYGNELLFILNGITGVFFWILLFKTIKKIPILFFFGKHTIPVLAMQVRALTLIKALLLFIFNYKNFNFTELEIVIITIAQLCIMYLAILFINKKFPILNGKRKALERGI